MVAVAALGHYGRKFRSSNCGYIFIPLVFRFLEKLNSCNINFPFPYPPFPSPYFSMNPIISPYLIQPFPFSSFIPIAGAIQ
jgi:hypothetical protein